MPRLNQNRSYAQRKAAGKKPGAMRGGTNAEMRQRLRSIDQLQTSHISEKYAAERALSEQNVARVRRGIEFEVKKWGPLSKDKFNRLFHGAVDRMRELWQNHYLKMNFQTQLSRHQFALEIITSPRLQQSDIITLRAMNFSPKVNADKLKLNIYLCKGEIESIERTERELYAEVPPSFVKVFNDEHTAQVFWNTIRQFVSPDVEHPQPPPKRLRKLK